jgi:hypothetical protein
MSGEDTARQDKFISPDERCRFSALRRYSEKARDNPSLNRKAQPCGSLKECTQYRMVPPHGIFVMRLRRPNRHRIHQRIIQAVPQVPEKDWPGVLVVMLHVAQST